MMENVGFDGLPGTSKATASWACEQCGADVKYEPGTRHLVCPYCQHGQDIPAMAEVEELDFSAFEEKASHAPVLEVWMVSCKQCGASSTLEPHIRASSCAFCGGALIAEDGESCALMQPGAILPFHITDAQAKAAFKKWIKSLWFAPSTLVQQADRADKLKGVYVPFWTFGAQANTPYVGQKGTYYYVTVPYVTTVNGKPTTRMRTERRTRWNAVSGAVDNTFDDVLVPASQQLPDVLTGKLAPWNLKEGLVAFDPSFLAGFAAEKYQIGLQHGLDDAKIIMEKAIQDTIRQDIGGDEQRIVEMHPAYQDITFKHILLPVWVSAFAHKNKTYRFLVNGQTGKVSGERPYDGLKIFLAVMAGILVIGAAVWLLNLYGKG